MKKLSRLSMFQFLVITIVATGSLLACSAATPGGTSIDSSAAVSGNYKSSCVQLGSVLAGAGYSQTELRLGYSGADSFTYSTYYHSDSSCATSSLYSALQQGTFSVGAPTSSPAGGFLITFSSPSNYIAAYNSSTYTTLSGGCTSHVFWTTTGSGGYGTVSGGSANCYNVILAPGNTTLYNVFVLSSSSISIGYSSNNNAGVTSSSSVPTSAAFSLTKY